MLKTSNNIMFPVHVKEFHLKNIIMIDIREIKLMNMLINQTFYSALTQERPECKLVFVSFAKLFSFRI